MKAGWMALACAAVLACGGSDDDAADEEGSAELGPATGALCDMSLTYANDIAPIMKTYCTTCHATALKGAARHDAPTDHNFDTEQGILDEKAHVDRAAGSGPNATNTFMPEAPFPAPSTEQRATLSKWLACQK